MNCINDAGHDCTKCGGHMKALCKQINSEPEKKNWIDRLGKITVPNGEGHPVTVAAAYWIMEGYAIATEDPRIGMQDGSVNNAAAEKVYAAHKYAWRALRICRKLLVGLPLTLDEKLVIESHEAGCWDVGTNVGNKFDPCDGCGDREFCLELLGK